MKTGAWTFNCEGETSFGSFAVPVDETEGWRAKEESAGVKNLFLFVLF